MLLLKLINYSLINHLKSFIMKKITLLVFAMMCFTMSAQYQFDLTSLPYTNGSNISYDAPTQTITWSAAELGTGAMGYQYVSPDYLDASAYMYLNIALTSVTGGAAAVRIYYSDGTNASTNLTTTADRTVYNIPLDAAKKSAISQIEFRLFGTPPTTVTIEAMELSTGTTLALSKVALPSLKTYPNPFNDNMAVECADIIKNISIYSISGQIVDKVTANSMKVNIATSNLSKGFYMLKIETEKGFQTVKMVK